MAAIQPAIISKFVIKKKNACVNVMDSLLETFLTKKSEKPEDSTTKNLIVPWVSQQDISLRKQSKI